MITFAVLALTEYTLTAAPTAQFTSPHHLTQAGEGKLLPGVLSAKMTSGTLSQMDLHFTCESDGPATVLATYCMKEAWDTIKIVHLAVLVGLFVILIDTKCLYPFYPLGSNMSLQSA